MRVGALKKIYRIRGLLMVPPMVFITLCTWGEVENEVAVFGAGGVIFGLGLALRIWAQTHLHYRLKMEKTLTQTGPYGYTRNPIYIANIFMLAGSCMLAELFWFVPIQVLWCAIIYSLVVRHEEAHLSEKYGSAYMEYVSQVPRWLPNLGRADKQESRAAGHFGPSMLVEVHNLLLLLPFIIKELIAR
jgi:protein-S-isoprenylcysteine O-methyltransferase Ste14